MILTSMQHRFQRPGGQRASFQLVEIAQHWSFVEINATLL